MRVSQSHFQSPALTCLRKCLFHLFEKTPSTYFNQKSGHEFRFLIPYSISCWHITPTDHLVDSADGSRQQSKEFHVSLLSSVFMNRGFWQAKQKHSYHMGLQPKAQEAYCCYFQKYWRNAHQNKTLNQRNIWHSKCLVNFSA